MNPCSRDLTANPFPEKQEIYECGEPAIGSSFVQFDLRFYVVALVFSSLVNAILFFRIIEYAYFGKGGDDHGHAAIERNEAPLMILSPLLLVAVALIVVGLSSGPLVENLIKLAIPAPASK